MHSGSAGRGLTIRMLLLDGTPDGLRLIDSTNWNGLVLMCGRHRYPAVRNRDEFNFPGVYFLYGPSPSSPNTQILYIGQADNVRERLDNHNRAKEFWSHLTVFTSRYGHLNKAHAQYLESRLIDLALRAQRAEVINGNAPRLPYLSESDRFDSESFLDQVLLLCPLLGLDFFAQVHPGPSLPRPQSVEPMPREIEPRPVPPTELTRAIAVRLDGPGASATGRAFGREVEVLAGATARLDHVPSLGETYVRLRQKLEAQGVLTRSPEGLIFTQNYKFGSPSGAAMILLGRPASGWKEWKDEHGRSLGQLQGSVAEAPVDVE
jgi:predicted GIY-YIG superfamily endonuclease